MKQTYLVMKARVWGVLLVLAICKSLNRSQTVERFAFGSCAGHFGAEYPEIWQGMLAQHPALFLWLGDAVYADTMYFPLLHKITPLDQWAAKYNRMKEMAGYRELRANVPILGVWDDHDYGINNGDRTHPLKVEAQQLYLDFLDEDKDSPRRAQEGLYASYLLGPQGKQVKLILLDVRYFRDPWSYVGDTLGEQQWKWLESELRSPGNLTFIASGIQILPQDRFGVTERFHPPSAERLMQLVAATPNAFLLSGDVHVSEVMKSTCLSRPVYEVTSSGLTHTAYTQYGFGGLIYNYLVQPGTYTTSPRVYQKSYCLVDIDWKAEVLSFSFLNAAGDHLYTESIQLNDHRTGKPPEWCAYSDLKRAVRHWTGSVILLLPAVLHVSAAVLYLRKYSHSY